MQIIRFLSEFSWIEICKFVEKTDTNGFLKIKSFDQSKYSSKFYIWFVEECIIAISISLNTRGLIHLIHKQGWSAYYTVERVAQTCPFDISLSTYLKSQSILNQKQLKHLFYFQILEPINRLSSWQKGDFEFETNFVVPSLEMTGLKLPLYEVIRTYSKNPSHTKSINLFQALNTTFLAVNPKSDRLLSTVID